MNTLSFIAAAAAAAPHAAPAAAGTDFVVRWARTQDEVREAQHLRWRVFAGEMGAHLPVPPGTPPEHDADRFDDHCEHLIVRAPSTDEEPGPVIGTPVTVDTLGAVTLRTTSNVAPTANRHISIESSAGGQLIGVAVTVK